MSADRGFPLLLAAALALAAIFSGCTMRTARPVVRPSSSAAPAEVEPGAGFHRMDGRSATMACSGLSPDSQGMRSWKDLNTPLARSLDFVRDMPGREYAVTRPDLSLTWAQMGDSLELLQSLLPELDDNPSLLGRHFVWYEFRPGPLMTGYYVPEAPAALVPDRDYIYPVYGVPPDLKRYKLDPRRAGGRNKWVVYRETGGDPMPYHDRRAIDVDGVLSGRGLELVWLRDPLERFALHVQGGGRVRLPDGSVRTLHYAADNGLEFTGLNNLLKKRGLIKYALGPGELVRFFKNRPQEIDELLAENRRYVFFKLADRKPGGYIGRPLTPMVSLATDPGLMPPGSVLALDAVIPGRNGRGQKRINGIGLAQDTGGAIRGPRLDYYVGSGREAGEIALHIKTRAGVRLLVSRRAMDRRPVNTAAPTS